MPDRLNDERPFPTRQVACLLGRALPETPSPQYLLDGITSQHQHPAAPADKAHRD
jgi:hypothetical protein